MILELVLAVVCQTTMPQELLRTTTTIADLPVGKEAYTYKEALVVSPDGKAYLKADYVLTYNDRYKELQVIHNKVGYIVRVLPIYYRKGNYYVYEHPKWNTLTYIRPNNFVPVKAIAIVYPHPNFAPTAPDLPEPSFYKKPINKSPDVSDEVIKFMESLQK
jgi:hypothetical protein